MLTRETLIGILLIALIILVVFLTVLVSNLTDTIKKTNAIIDGGTNVAASAKAKVDNVSSTVKEGASRVTGIVAWTAGTVFRIWEKILRQPTDK